MLHVLKTMELMEGLGASLPLARVESVRFYSPNGASKRSPKGAQKESHCSVARGCRPLGGCAIIKVSGGLS